MKIKNKIFLTILVLSLFLVVPMVLGDTATLRTPASSSTQSATAKINISVSQPNSNYTGCTSWATNTNVNATRVTIIANMTPSGGGGMSINASFNGTYVTSMLQDSAIWTFNGACNSTNNTVVTTSNNGITIDNTVPTAPTITSPSTTITITSAGTQTFTSTVTDANTNGCTYTIARGGAISGSDYYSGTGAYATTSCSFTKDFSSTVDNGLWYVYAIATDGTNTTSSALSTYNVQFVGSGSGGNLRAIIPASIPVPGQPTPISNLWQQIVNFFKSIFS